MSLPLHRTFIAVICLSILGACDLPQDFGEEGQILKGVEDPAATFALELVTRATMPQLKSWPDSHPVSNPGWIAHASTGSDPLIEAGDILDLTIWDNDDSSLLSPTGQKIVALPGLKVSSKGTIFIPYADEVYVAKMTPDEARKVVQDKILSIIPSAQVLLHFVSGSNNSVTLVSGLPAPGTYPLPSRNTTITQILSLGGGIPGGSGNLQVNLSRGGKIYRIPAETLLSDPTMDTTLRGGDKIFIEPDRRYFLSLGAVGTEAVYSFPRAKVSALDAMSMLGGVNQSSANPKGILILRDYPQSAVRSDGKGPSRDRMIFALDLTSADGLFSAGEFAIQDRDLILVTQSPLVNTRTIFGLIGSIFGLSNTVDSGLQKLGT